MASGSESASIHKHVGADRPVVADLEGENQWTLLARKHWQKTTAPGKIRIKPNIIKTEIWDVLESEAFAFRSLLILENLQILENYLWPGYNTDATHYHVLLMAIIATVKGREGLPVWKLFSDNPEAFASFFRRVLSMSLDDTLTTTIRTHLLSFLINAFQSLDNGLIRKECAPLVSISVWQNLASEEAREKKFEQHGQLRKAWRAATRRFEAADEATQAKLRFERSWLYTMILDFAKKLYHSEGLGIDNVLYCERFLEFLTDLESQLPTRRYVNTLIQNLNLLALIRTSPLFNNEDNMLFRDLYMLLRHFVNFSIDDNTGAPYSRAQTYESHCERLASFQKTALKHFKLKLTIFALSNYAAIDRRPDLEGHLLQLTDQELVELCRFLGFRTEYPPGVRSVADRQLLLEIIISNYERRKTFEEVIRDLSILPTELTLYEPSLLRNETYNGAQPLAIPKLNLQYLSIGDFLWRSFILYRCESFFEIRKDVEDVVKRLQPKLGTSGNEVRFNGFSRMAMPIPKPALVRYAPAGRSTYLTKNRILDVAAPKVGTDYPAFVRAEITLDVSKLADSVWREWDSLRPDDVVYLITISPQDNSHLLTDGHWSHPASDAAGLATMRSAEVLQILDESSRPIRHMTNGENGYTHKPRLRRLLVNIDAAEYKSDMERKSMGKPDVYDAINVVVRRKGRENNFKKILESIRSLALSDVPAPSWLQDVFLGYGDPAGATYQQLPNRIRAVDFRDTFLDWSHLVESLPNRTIEPFDSHIGGTGPPYILETSSELQGTAPRPSKKRRRHEMQPLKAVTDSIRVSTYKLPSNGPYPVDAPKTNQVRFTPAQVDAIASGTQPGLTMIVGPPGTGKTDTVTQIISNIYHDFPAERVLLIAHSNQALNQLFQKITRLDIDQRHLLRLGHGEGDLETDVSYGKHGRVESFLDNRGFYLAEVDRLAANFGAPGAHGGSCETAGYFNAVYVLPAWSKFWDFASAAEAITADIISVFPFYDYFSNAPQPLFDPSASKSEVLDIAAGCERHIAKIFAELSDIRPFEILRNSRDKANYLLVKEARIIAMTSTHAAMRRQEISDLGFHYDNIIMEEAAQITEIESFIPLALQHPKNGDMPLRRIILCGDHLQNSPIVQNLAFRQFANLEQSLFLRLVRLGVPTINLDAQGRARASIAELYKWRYPKLGNLPKVLQDPEFQIANAGFRHEYQFINVPDYKGIGETQPSPHFIQNLGEAEYAVAIYQYMRLLGYPKEKISILATYAGQRALIRDVLGHRCAKNRLFGLPCIVTTVDKYQGEQNDYIILSLTRTLRAGYLRDIRRLTVALSRARLGLYILGRREVFETCFELRPAFELLFQRTDKLMLTQGETFGEVGRGVDAEVQATEMAGVEHLGQYVYEMTRARMGVVEGASHEENVEMDVEEQMDVDGEGEVVELEVVDEGREDEDVVE